MWAKRRCQQTNVDEARFANNHDSSQLKFAQGVDACGILDTMYLTRDAPEGAIFLNHDLLRDLRRSKRLIFCYGSRIIPDLEPYITLTLMP